MKTISLIRNRNNRITVHLGVDVTGMALKSEIRRGPSETSDLAATWDIRVADAATGTLEMTVSGDLFPAEVDTLYTDIVNTNNQLTLMPVVRISVTEGVTV